jgi:hypothetical protein
MKVAHVRLAAAAVLFLGWIGWLAYLVVNSHDPVILSRPQFLVADLWVIADVGVEDGRPARMVSVREDVWSSAGKKLAGATIEVVDLPEIGADKGWEGPGTYILPLLIHAGGKRAYYSITPVPPSPGFVERGDRRIYAATPETRAQLKSMLSEWNRAH